MEREKVTAENLSSVMDFRHVIQVHEDGTVTDGNKMFGMHVPILTMDVDADGQSIHANDEDIISQAKFTGWSLVDGFSSQYRYHGPVMHSSERIGGNMARAILETPGYYVSIVVECEGPESDPEESENTLDPAGWAVAYREV